MHKLPSEIRQFIDNNKTYSYKDILYENQLKLAKNSSINVRMDSMLPWLDIKLKEKIDWGRIYEEAKSVDSLFVPHRDGGDHYGWSSLVIHGLSYNKTQAYERYGYEDEPNELYKWTEIKNRIPYTVEVFKKTFPYNSYKRIRFMRLSPGGYIMPHKDDNWRHLGPVNISLNQPAGCSMYIEDYGKIPFQEHKLFHVDISRYHTVFNNSDGFRYHIIVHGDPGSIWNEILNNSLKHQMQINDISNRRKHVSKVNYVLNNWDLYKAVDKHLNSFTIINTSIECDDFERGSLAKFIDMNSSVIERIEILAGDKREVDLEKNCLYISSDIVNYHLSKKIVYDEDYIDDVIHNENGELHGRVFYYINEKVLFEISNTSDKTVSFYQISCVDEVVSNLRVHDSLERISKEEGGCLAEYLVKNVARQGLKLDESLLSYWQSSGLKSTFMDFIRIIVVTSTETPNAKLDKVTYPSFLPMELNYTTKEYLIEYLNKNNIEKYKAVLIVGEGQFLKDKYEFYFEILKNYWDMTRKNEYLRGHILNKKGGKLPAMHEQLVMIRSEIINYGIDHPVDEMHGYTVSEDDYHDGYTPHYIEPSKPNKNERINGKSGFLTSCINNELERGHGITNWCERVRDLKIHYYLDSDDNREQYKIRKAISKIYNDSMSDIYFRNNQLNDLEKVFDFTTSDKIDYLLHPCSGLDLLRIIKKYEVKKLITYDISTMATDFWDCLFQVKNQLQVESLINEYTKDTIYGEKNTLSDFHNIVDNAYGSFEKYIEFISTCDIKVLNLNLLENYKELVDKCPKNMNGIIYLSNIYEYEPILYKLSTVEVREKFESMVSYCSEILGGTKSLSDTAMQAVVTSSGMKKVIFCDERSFDKSLQNNL